MIGKYVERLVFRKNDEKKESRITEDMLREGGFCSKFNF